VEKFLGRLGNKGLSCMANPCERAAYILSKIVFFTNEALVSLNLKRKKYLNYTNITRSLFALLSN
jgi:hypothetical protein